MNIIKKGQYRGNNELKKQISILESKARKEVQYRKKFELHQKYWFCKMSWMHSKTVILIKF